MSWPEVLTAKSQNRHELVLSGADISKRIEERKGQVDPALFDLININYLCVSETCLSTLHVNVARLKGLTTLVLHTNKLTQLPDCVGDLDKLKILDVSRNELSAVPETLTKLSNLTSLNVSSNKIVSLPSFKDNLKLSILDASQNELEEFPDLVYPELAHLAEVKLKANKIADIPRNISCLPSLRLLDLEENSVKIVPGELADNSKLKEVLLKGNKLNDKRLMKMVDQCKPKQILEYIGKNCPKEKVESGGGKKGKKGKGKQQSDNKEAEVEDLCNKIAVLHVGDDTLKVISEDETVKLVRPHIVCCIIRDVKFTTETFRSFIQMQTRLHDTTCQKRQLATIATHDLALFPSGPLQYLARPPARIKLVPLGQDKVITAAEMFKNLQEEAEEEKRTQSASGIFRYLTLLEGKQVYPFLKNSQGKTVSLPPITNSELTKITESTKDIFVEITSASSQNACKTVLHQLLLDTMELGIGDFEDAPGFHSLKVQQVQVVNAEGTLKVVYPSRADLQVEESQKIVIIRE
ncbi:leucine-rich repeat-containing protein 47-like [Neocloeon triangulifer]|uniref:leucine-rich repeat-containing protein 47-like n=1 Tax=Neocloeon triangulifer TaxID=2078957 RepID=UPI00286F859E|nr:leucine-rich repeat-containing protein 47-like [Neocloeon triangulifer]XP_059490081.1 leucine-rich repeat-containing protein 47-like [Neocloeon triangulifer]